MDINWYGQSCFKLKGKTTALVIDPFGSGKTDFKLPKDFSAPLVLVTHGQKDSSHLAGVSEAKLIIDGPGEYEFMGVTVNGTRTFDDNTAFNILIDGINVVHLGELGQPLTEEQVNEIDGVDILMIPVGGVSTIDAKVAAAVVAQLEPRVVIPMYFQDVEIFLKEMGVDNTEPVAKFAITRDKLPEETQIVVMSKS